MGKRRTLTGSGLKWMLEQKRQPHFAIGKDIIVLGYFLRISHPPPEQNIKSSLTPKTAQQLHDTLSLAAKFLSSFREVAEPQIKNQPFTKYGG